VTLIVSNGIAFSPTGARCTLQTRVATPAAYDLDLDDGVISNRRIFVDYTSTRDRVDGACVDVDGCL
jgi:sugar lactone lactonase YvrE